MAYLLTVQVSTATAALAATEAPAKAELGSKDAVAAGDDTKDEAATSPADTTTATTGDTAAAVKSAEEPTPADAPVTAASAEGSSGMPPTTDAAATSGGSSGGFGGSGGGNSGGFKGGFSFGGNLAKSVGSGFGALAGVRLTPSFNVPLVSTNAAIHQSLCCNDWDLLFSTHEVVAALGEGTASTCGGFGALGAQSAAAAGSESDGGLFGSKPAFAFGSSASAEPATAALKVFGSPAAGGLACMQTTSCILSMVCLASRMPRQCLHRLAITGVWVHSQPAGTMLVLPRSC